MLRPRTFALALALVAATAACKKEGAGAVGGAAGGLDLKSSLRLYSKDTDALIGINVQKIRESALYKKYEPQLLEKASGDLAKLKEACGGTDPVAKLTSATIGIKADKTATVIVRGVDKATAVTCSQKFAEQAKAKGETAEATVEGNFLRLKKGDDPEIALLFMDDTTILTASKDDGTPLGKAELEAIAKGLPEAESIAGSAELNDALGRTDTSDAVWFIANGSAPSFQTFPFKFKSAFGSLEVADGIKLDASARMESEEVAKSTTEQAQAQVQQLKSMLGAMIGDIAINQKGTDVQVTATMTQQQIESIANMASGMGGGMAAPPPAPAAPAAPAEQPAPAPAPAPADQAPPTK